MKVFTYILVAVFIFLVWALLVFACCGIDSIFHLDPCVGRLMLIAFIGFIMFAAPTIMSWKTMNDQARRREMSCCCCLSAASGLKS